MRTPTTFVDCSMWRHQGVTTGKRSDTSRFFAHPQRGKETSKETAAHVA
jgi:hypothetical protein